jgi:Uma2 family endonuclease
MATLTIELPRQEVQTESNIRRWTELLADREMAKFEGRVETDRHGNIIMSPPPAPKHGSYQLEIGYFLRSLLPSGRALTECPISTADGVKAADVAWASNDIMKELGKQTCFPHAPEICVEVLSPGNLDSEIREKVALYFDAGAKEVWICSQNGEMTFHNSATGRPLKASKLCPKFPVKIVLR